MRVQSTDINPSIKVGYSFGQNYLLIYTSRLNYYHAANTK